MHILSLLFSHDSAPQEILIEQSNRDNFPPDPPPPEKIVFHTKGTTTTLIQVTTTTALATTTATIVSQPSAGPSSDSPLDFVPDLPPTTLVAHAPGWTVFRDIFMSNDTFYVVTDQPSEFPEIRMMISTPLESLAEDENIKAREPSQWSMSFITPVEAGRKWGADVRHGRRNRVSSVDGNTVLVNEPTQFLRHYYHLVAELIFGTQAIWHGAFTAPSNDTERDYSLGPFPPPRLPSIALYSPARMLMVGAILRDSIAILCAQPFLARQSKKRRVGRIVASFRGQLCGSQTQRIAAEAYEAMHNKNQLAGIRVGGWWEPLRAAALRFAGAEVDAFENTEQVSLDSDIREGDPKLAMPSKIVITYISRQGVKRRKLTPKAHEGLVHSLEELVKRKGPSWELNIVEAEKLTRDQQLQLAARTTILLGVHGNGLTHLVMMPPTRISTVIEIFYPGGFAHDYQWTTRALGMKHFAIWDDKYRTEGAGEGKPDVNYPEGFQEDYIPMSSAVPRPRPRPRPVPRAKVAQTASASNAPIDDDSMFIRNKSRDTTTWQKFEALDNASRKKTPRSDTEDDSDSPRPKKQSKTKTRQAAHAEMRRVLSNEPSTNSESDIEILDTPSKQKKKGKQRRSRSRSLTPPPAIPEQQLRDARAIVRQALGGGSERQSRSPTPPPIEANNSIEYAPEIQSILRAAQTRSGREESSEAEGSRETIELTISWKQHPKDTRPPTWKEPIIWKIHRTDNFHRVMDEAADEAKILLANLVLSHNHTRIFPSASPASLGLWDDAELEACEQGTWDYIRSHSTTNPIIASPVKRKPAVVEEEDGVLVVSDTDSSIIEVDTQPDSDSDHDEASAAEHQGGGEGANENNHGDSFKLILRSALTTNKDISLNVRSTTKCGTIVQAFLKKAGIADNYPAVIAGTSTSKGPRKRGKGKKGAEPAKEPKLEIDGDRVGNDEAIGNYELEDGDVVDVVGL
ncbi:hypothetical protein MIND_00846600 [Mycena indigotica]|uniref:Glycosyltransferase 61 catalytic domain-containing protein n=1 Tax=Mycena indigotica TaxID=2126181 RepID=A0A8H6SGJ0_9AGAR|nr:uncharacterized protein MIND_00846600 [Mycena indigotica]KAF7298984.1 hypothetical protein MIND_00846600 [Mycena indigotica]